MWNRHLETKKHKKAEMKQNETNETKTHKHAQNGQKNKKYVIIHVIFAMKVLVVELHYGDIKRNV